MTLPHISAPAWTVRRSIVLTPPRSWPARRPAGARVGAFVPSVRRIAWIDVMIQLAGAAAVIGLIWMVVAGGVLQRGVVSFADWYADTAVPAFSAGTEAVLPGARFQEGVFGVAGQPSTVLTGVTAVSAPAAS